MKAKIFCSIVLWMALGKAQEYNPHNVYFKGYTRTGLGVSEGGGEMVDFKAPYHLHKYRMGNEANHYAELQLGYEYKEKDSDKSYEMQYMMARYVEYGDDSKVDFPETAQLYLKMNNVLGKSDVWIGKRYYDRRNVELLDYFWLNSGQQAEIGVGVEQIEMPKTSHLNVSLLKFKYDTPALQTAVTENDRNRNSYTLDARLLDYPLAESHQLNLLAQGGYMEGVETQGLKQSFSWSLGGWWTYRKNFITHTSTVLFRTGSLIVPTPYTGQSVMDYELQSDGSYLRKYDYKKAYTLDVINNFVYDDKRRHAVQATMVYRNKSYGIGNVDVNQVALDNKRMLNTFSVGFRYLYYLHRHFNLALEFGSDHISDSRSGVSGSLQKITFSPQISWDYGYYSRPVLRPFVTYANWSDDFKGLVGVSAYNSRFANANRAFTYGLQLETWW